MTLSIIDTHAHLDMHQFDEDRTGVIRRALEAGVITMVNPAVDLKSAEKIIRLSESEPHIFPAAGFHPHEVSNVSEADIKILAGIVKQDGVVAIGETGLDYYRNKSPRETQLHVLKAELELAADTKLPIIIHCREAERDMLALLGNWIANSPYPDGVARGVIHCFSGNGNILKQYLEMGFYVSLGGYLTYPTSVRHFDMIKNIPVDRLLLETDCPYLPPQPYRGQRNEPAYLVMTAALLAKVRGTTAGVLARQTTENARRLFHLPEIK
ncbi:MAG: TatD family hydrolase [Chloroflexota bacterium]